MEEGSAVEIGRVFEIRNGNVSFTEVTGKASEDTERGYGAHGNEERYKYMEDTIWN